MRGVAKQSLLVENLPEEEVAVEELVHRFQEFGRLRSVSYGLNPRMSDGVSNPLFHLNYFATIDFWNPSNAIKACKSLNGTELKGKPMMMSVINKRIYRPKYVYYKDGAVHFNVPDLGLDVTEDLLYGKFSKYGSCRVQLAAGDTSGFAYVYFFSQVDANKAIKALNGAVVGSSRLLIWKRENQMCEYRRWFSWQNSHYDKRIEEFNLLQLFSPVKTKEALKRLDRYFAKDNFARVDVAHYKKECTPKGDFSAPIIANSFIRNYATNPWRVAELNGPGQQISKTGVQKVLQSPIVPWLLNFKNLLK